MGLGVDVFYAYDESLVSKEETANDLSKIFVTVLHAYKRNKLVVTAGLKSLTRLLAPTKQEKNDVLWRRQYGEAGLCTILLGVCKVHLEDATIVSLCLTLICQLGLERENKRILGIKGACELVCQILSHPTHLQDVPIQTQLLTTVSHLSVEMDANNKRMGDAAACRLVCQVTRRFSTLRSINLTGCQAILNLARLDENRRLLGQEGACQAVHHAIAHFMPGSDHTCEGYDKEYRIKHHNHTFGDMTTREPQREKRREEGEGEEEEEEKEEERKAKQEQKILLYAVWAIIALASASDENKRILNKIDAAALLTKLQRGLPLQAGQGFFASKIKIALDRLQTRLIILT